MNRRSPHLRRGLGHRQGSPAGSVRGGACSDRHAPHMSEVRPYACRVPNAQPVGSVRGSAPQIGDRPDSGAVRSSTTPAARAATVRGVRNVCGAARPATAGGASPATPPGALHPRGPPHVGPVSVRAARGPCRSVRRTRGSRRKAVWTMRCASQSPCAANVRALLRASTYRSGGIRPNRMNRRPPYFPRPMLSRGQACGGPRGAAEGSGAPSGFPSGEPEGRSPLGSARTVRMIPALN
jgi:hypothetical protein